MPVTAHSKNPPSHYLLIHMLMRNTKDPFARMALMGPELFVDVIQRPGIVSSRPGVNVPAVFRCETDSRRVPVIKQGQCSPYTCPINFTACFHLCHPFTAVGKKQEMLYDRLPVVSPFHLMK